MDKDRRVSTETISAQFDVSVGTVHIIIREELKMRKICAKFVPRVLREDQKERRCPDRKETVELINSDLAVLDALVTWDESWIYCYDPETKRQSSQGKLTGSPRPKKARQRKSTHKLLMIPFFWQHRHDLHALGSLWTDCQQGILCWGFKGVQFPVTFGYSRSTETVDKIQLRRWKRLWRRSLTRSHKRTSMGPPRSCWNGTTSALQPDEITSKGTWVSYVYYQ